MTAKGLERISAEQKKIVDEHLSSYPIKLGELARELGVAGIKISSMPRGISGQIMKEGGDYIIRINRNEARERQRFTIAHELAHFLLHREIIDHSTDGISDNVLYRSDASAKIEREANELAADLVMPMDLIKQALDDDFSGVVTEATIESLAGRFQVSKATMEIRLSKSADV